MSAIPLFNLDKTIFFLQRNITIISVIILILYIIGIINSKSELILQINFVFKIIIALYLIFRFNSNKSDLQISKVERKLIYSSGVYILIFSFADIITVYLDVIRNFLSPYTGPILTKIDNKFPVIKQIQNKIGDTQTNILEDKTIYTKKINNNVKHFFGNI
jgi:hypothetical protein